ncbi:DUF2277 domain-containing protein [Mycobacterium uberis]|uniref:DUF2277 domain-containing protein n=2 Tax=Mycobacterium uberis TaxID=2162698 RepID=A0A3E1HGN3_9MYCO|nr:DUF2277 family protein [Mycobacterium uberis]RFD25394.1 DUF2277 domain-containing protein [Mycobacterium uberis]
MYWNSIELHRLQYAATAEEIVVSARRYVPKISGIIHLSTVNAEAFEAAFAEVNVTTTRLRTALLPRRQTPKTMPSLRRLTTG